MIFVGDFGEFLFEIIEALESIGFIDLVLFDIFFMNLNLLGKFFTVVGSDSMLKLNKNWQKIHYLCKISILVKFPLIATLILVYWIHSMLINFGNFLIIIEDSLFVFLSLKSC